MDQNDSVPTPGEETAPLAPTPASQWKGALKVEGTDLLLPSGNVCRVKQISPMAFLQSGMIPDQLTVMMRKAIHSGQGLNPKDLEDIAEDPDQMADAMMMVDRVVAFCLVEPEAAMPPVCRQCQHYFQEGVHADKDQAKEGYHRYVESVRDSNVLYTDVIQMDDKMFIMQFVMGGVRELEPFREQQSGVLESLQKLQDVAGTPEPDAESA